MSSYSKYGYGVTISGSKTSYNIKKKQKEEKISLKEYLKKKKETK